MLLFPITVIVSILVAVIVLFLGLGFTRIGNRSKSDEEYSKLIAELTQSEVQSEEEKSGIPSAKTWTGYWFRLAQDSGWQQASVGTASRLALGIILFAFLIGYFVWPQDLLAGFGFAVGGVIIYRFFLVAKAKARKKLMEKQLPNLINGMRANLQANLTPQQAILSQVDEIPAPLGDELQILRQEMNVNVPLDVALSNLSMRVPSREIKFLVSSIKIAIASGVDLDPQLKIIQEIIVQRSRIANSLASAVASVQPSIAVAAVAIPAGFLFSYYSSTNNRDFWAQPFGWLALAVIGALYAAGLFIARKLVARVEDA